MSARFPGLEASDVAWKRMRQELVRRDEQVQRLTRALADIADADYRGNRTPESQMAHDALVREGLRPE